MNKALELGGTSATGGFKLFIGKSMSTVIMAVASIILARLLSPGEYGVYSVALVPSVTFGLFCGWGTTQAMTKFVAQYKTENREQDIRDIIVTGSLFNFATSLTLSFLSLFLANFIATTFFNRPETTTLISVASVVIFSNALLNVSQSIFTGFEKMQFTSYMLVCQSIIKCVVSPILVLVGYGVLGAVLGHTLSFLFSAVFGVSLVYFLFVKKLKKSNRARQDRIKTLKEMLRYGLPLSLSAILGSFLLQFYAFLMAFYCSDAMVGNYQIAANFAVFLTFFSFPITTVLFPAFSKLDPKSELQLLRTVFSSAVKYASLFLVPATMATIVLSEPLVSTVFGQKWLYAPNFLTFYILSNLLVLFGGLIITSLLSGIGETKILLKLSLLKLSIGVPLAFILIPMYGIIGVILGTFFADIPYLSVGAYWLWKHYGATPDFKLSAKIFSAAAVAAMATYLSLSLLAPVAYWIKLIIGGTIFLAIYLITAPIIGAISQKDVQTLRTMFSGLGVISKLINAALSLEEKLVILVKPK